MEELVARIKQDGTVLGDDILKVDSFLTHQVDPKLMRQIGRVFAAKFADAGITKVVTIEASGNVPAAYVAEALDVPMIFAKKAKNVTMTDELLTADVYSFTKKITSTVQISRKFLLETDKVLVIDDFLANGQAALGLIKILHEAGAQVAGIGIVIEKSFQTGRGLVEETGIPVFSLARIAGFDAGEVVFAEADL
ncbi:xanthine phosphoribosyltransferase [Pseudolactococcus insecticola]|uniref:Xanthine phosphoribosyltransferase n=1 Tax=Pseudolactococcus insecticola TaxID=2709158 RepID=A0A6A0BAY5_9LACT|nr:xanthine phosphoribosyltransferase [Lactococcus insecticola]GFH40957.1 xanthine phosphoribosyltransferase [Lactococcus insecticola]